MAKETTATERPAMNTRTSDPKSPERAGAVISIVNLALDVGDRGSATAHSLVQDARGELRTAVDTGIDATEAVVRGLFRFAKRITARVDDLAGELTSASERTVAGLVGGLRDTTRAAGELASTAADAVVGTGASNGRAVAQA
ncbi:MAG: hypothetical protein H6709_16855 [Kofleriaceae bacterium]|nr:hypothetical protein [Kofleriaceae bacterium]MCB9573751.1 hypothetical protein [Kofleriaceae bacterium]